jgi:hypothetical protein
VANDVDPNPASRREDRTAVTVTTYDEYLRHYRPAEWEAQQVAEQAEVLHAERHSGLLVPTLDSCAQHTRTMFESMARSIRALREAAEHVANDGSDDAAK